MATDAADVNTENPALRGAEIVRLYLMYHTTLNQDQEDHRVTTLRLDFEIALQRLHKRGELNPREALMIALFTRGFSIADIAAVLLQSKRNVKILLNTICAKISHELGDDYFEVSKW